MGVGDDDIERCGRHFVFPGERGLLGAGRWAGEDRVMSSSERLPLLLGVSQAKAKFTDCSVRG